MKKSFLNLLVDTLSLFVFVALTSTGLILEWKLPPGSGRVVGPEGPDHPLTMLWGWDHTNGEISTLFWEYSSWLSCPPTLRFIGNG